MRSTMRLTLTASLMLAVTACVGSPRIVASPSACTSLLPDNWLKGVTPAPLPAPAPVGTDPSPAGMLERANGELKKWTAYGVDMAVQFDQANARYSDAIGIMQRCEARDAAAIKAAKPKLLGIF